MLYRPSLGLLTDLYQLTMAAGYHRAGVHNRPPLLLLGLRQQVAKTFNNPSTVV